MFRSVREEVPCFAALTSGGQRNFREINFTIRRARLEVFLCIPRSDIPLDCTGTVLMQHAKMIIAIMHDEGLLGGKGNGKKADYDSDTDTDTDMEDDVIEIKDEKVGWAYIGSHNFTPSAWGNLSGSSFNPVLNVSGLSCGSGFVQPIWLTVCFRLRTTS